jgi:hypothetical protein
MTALDRIIEAIRLGRPGVVGVDGDLGAGKTTIATQIAERVRCDCIHLDSFLLQGRESFLPSLDYQRLATAVSSRTGTVVLEGVCLLAALQRLRVIPDYLVFVESEDRFRNTPRSHLLGREVGTYFAKYSPRSKANAIISLESSPMSSQYDVEIAYLRSKTLLAVVLAVGGLAQTISGVLLLNAGLNEQGTATLRIMGAEVSATGLGGIILSTSVLWAFLAYLSRPKFSARSETRTNTRADGSAETSEFRSATMTAAAPTPATPERKSGL